MLLGLSLPMRMLWTSLGLLASFKGALEQLPPLADSSEMGPGGLLSELATQRVVLGLVALHSLGVY